MIIFGRASLSPRFGTSGHRSRRSWCPVAEIQAISLCYFCHRICSALTLGVVRSLVLDAGEPLAENSDTKIGGPFEPETANTVEGSNLQSGPQLVLL